MIPWMREKLSKRFSSVRRKRTTLSNGHSPAHSDRSDSTVTEDAEPVEDLRLPRRLDSLTPTPVHRPVFAACHRNVGTATATTTATTTPTRAVETPATQEPKEIFKSRGSRTSSCSTSGTETPHGSAANSNETIVGPQKERIKVRVICPSARLLTFDIDVNKRLAELKVEIIIELTDDPASLPLFATDVRNLCPRYRLMRADYQGTELNETMTLTQLKIADGDTLVLVNRRTFLLQRMAHAKAVKAPNHFEVDAATSDIPENITLTPIVDINEIFQQSNLQFDVRKVLISLAQVSATVIGAGPYASRLIDMLKQKLINKRNYQNDTLQCLIDMGFSKERAEYALKIQQGIYAAALEWLIQRQSLDMSVEQAAMGMEKSQSFLSPSGILTNNTLIENTQALLEIVRIYSHREIPPSAEAVTELTEMGFEEADVLLALKKTCNNKAAACEWLCGNRSGSLTELREGLAQDSPILKTILEMPQVQVNLSNPKIFLALLGILENEHSIRVWGGDNDTSSVITHILQKYHEEKHVLGINQFYTNR